MLTTSAGIQALLSTDETTVPVHRTVSNNLKKNENDYQAHIKDTVKNTF